MAESRTVHRYPAAALHKSYLLVVAGVVVVSLIAFAARGNIVLSVLCITIVVFFVAYGARTYARGKSAVIVDDSGLHVAGPWPRSARWKELTGLRLAYYTTRRDGENGWMELSVRGRDGRITLDSDIDGFAEIADRCRAAADALDLELSPSTRRNFEAARSGMFAGGGR